nr:pilus assembly protein [Acidobacteriota bacterium]
MSARSDRKRGWGAAREGKHGAAREGERGAALLEFAIGATVFMTVVFGVLQFGVLLWTHNALTGA